MGFSYPIQLVLSASLIVSKAKAGVVDPDSGVLNLNIDLIILNEQPSTNVDSFKQESATILSFDTGFVNE